MAIFSSQKGINPQSRVTITKMKKLMPPGCFHWTLVDNFEWERGWTQHFGLWGLDEATQKRIRRPSVDLFAEICRLNGISSEIVEKYAPDAMPRVFPPA